ncbi:UDP-glycosyltransferase 708G1-like [Euphorbia lathyris]|uniref:UDP-glycosyltransferase 708G1-like n=1 Tax=Euphorbia lathyris TaxID=212925 RepID=UPI0033140377
MSGFSNHKHGHIAVVPSAGMGHLIPFLRLASLLSSHNLKVTIITPNPTVSLSESQTLLHFFTSFPQITQMPFHLLPSHPTPTNSKDPFFYHMERIHQSSHLLLSLLPSLSPPLSALITDVTLTSSLLPITQSLNLPNYILFTSSAQMLTLCLHYHSIMDSIASTDDESLQISIPRSLIPPQLLGKTEDFFKTSFAENGKQMTLSTGILVNTFQSIELSTLNKLNTGGVIAKLPPVIAIGPLVPLIDEKKSQELTWLGRQPAGSVVYVSFGSRTAMSREQLRELGEGLVRSGSRFLWVVKDKKVDTEDEQGLDEIIGSGLMEKMKENGMVLKNWANQEEILGHESIGCFMSHCGWNSVTEAIWNGVRVLAWPQHGDQKMNADIVDKIGLGIWPKKWGWGGEMVVNGTEIAESIKEIMGNEVLRVGALHIQEEAKRAVELGGSSDKELRDLIQTWKQAHVDVVVV